MNVKEKYNYLASEDYDKKYKIKDEKILCMSEKKLEEIHPNGDCVVCGETIRNNKKRKFASITLAGEELYVSKYGGALQNNLQDSGVC